MSKTIGKAFDALIRTADGKNSDGVRAAGGAHAFSQKKPQMRFRPSICGISGIFSSRGSIVCDFLSHTPVGIKKYAANRSATINVTTGISNFGFSVFLTAATIVPPTNSSREMMR